MKLTISLFGPRCVAMYCLAFLLPMANAQVASDSELYQTIIKQDRLLFEQGFNHCDLKQLEKSTSTQLEFFHDKGGRQNQAEFIAAMRKNLCFAPEKYQSRRALIEPSVQVFPLQKNGELYGALQVGVHQFYEKNADQPERYASTARFSHLWIKENNEWKLAKIISYDHNESPLAALTSKDFDNDQEISQWLQDNHIPVLGLGVISGGVLQQVKVFGNLLPNKPAPFNTVFNVASLTKPITTLVTLKLVDQRKWNLDESLSKYWTDPDIAADPRAKLLTTRHVLTHQTGFKNWRFLNPDGKLAFDFAPGTQYQYSGEGMEYLRKALEKKFKKSLPQLADELIFKPLRMADTRFTWTAQTDASRFAPGYNADGKSYGFVKNTRANAADDLQTTIADYGNFMSYLINGAGLSPKLYQEMVSHQVERKAGKKYFGLGLEVYDLGGGEFALSHGGADKGVQALFFVLPKSKRGLLIVTNVDDGYKVYERLIKHYLGASGAQLFAIETE